MNSQETVETPDSGLKIERRNPLAKAAVDAFVAEMPKMIGPMIEKLKTDVSFTGSISEGTGEARRVTVQTTHNGFHIRLLVYVEARNIEFEEMKAGTKISAS